MQVEGAPSSPASNGHDREDKQKYLIPHRIDDVGVAVITRQIVSREQVGHGREKIDIRPVNEQRGEVEKPKQARTIGAVIVWLKSQRSEHRNKFDEEQELPGRKRRNGPVPPYLIVDPQKHIDRPHAKPKRNQEPKRALRSAGGNTFPGKEESRGGEQEKLR